ncbi:hypothetical protein [Allomuricauda sp. d1]|uniref:hypothetical protein n=1 Tax=Allomuricauda sp. d1 TaxID=3136725 RepID=UPI0031DC56D8
MNYLPFENIEIQTSKTKEEILRLLENNIEPNETLGFIINKSSNQDYEGIIDKSYSEFRIRRILKSGRNSFIPIVYGKLKEKGNGLTVSLKIRLQKVVAGLFIFMSIFALGMVIISFNSKSESKEIIEKIYQDPDLRQELKNNKELQQIYNSGGFDWTALILLLFLYAMTMFFFNREAEKAKDDLKRMIN